MRDYNVDRIVLPGSSGRGDYNDAEREYSGRSPGLREAFAVWLEWMSPVDRPKQEEEQYHLAVSRLGGLDRIDPHEMNFILRSFKDHKHVEDCGPFLSAVYNMCGEDEIVFDTKNEVVPGYLGYGLNKGKTVVIMSDVWNAGLYSDGNFVNFARVRNLGDNTTRGITLNYKEACVMAHVNGFPSVNYADTAISTLDPDYRERFESSFGPNGKSFLINFGTVFGDMAHGAGSLNINCGKVRRMCEPGVMLGININMGEIEQPDNIWRGEEGIGKCVPMSDFPELMSVISKLLDDVGPDKHYMDVIKTLSDPVGIWDEMRAAVVARAERGSKYRRFAPPLPGMPMAPMRLV